MLRDRSVISIVGIALVLLVGLMSWTGRARATLRSVPDENLEVRVWTDRGDGGIYDSGDRIRVYFEASHDCYVTLYNIDTEGFVHVLFPYDYDGSNFVRGGVVYRLPDRGDRYDLVVDGPKGIEYIQAVASFHPYPVPRWPRYWDPHHRWKNRFRGIAIRYIERISGDPYEGMLQIVGTLLPVGYSHLVTTDYTFFYVLEEVLFPRYLYYDWHGGPGFYWSIYWRPFDPYRKVCVVYEVQVYDDWRYVRHVRRCAPQVVRPVVVVERYREKRWYVRRKEPRPVRRVYVEKRVGYPNGGSTKDKILRSWNKYGEERVERRRKETSEKMVRTKGRNIGYQREKAARAPVRIERREKPGDHRVGRREKGTEIQAQRDKGKAEKRIAPEGRAKKVSLKDRNIRRKAKAERVQKALREKREDDRVERRKRR